MFLKLETLNTTDIIESEFVEYPLHTAEYSHLKMSLFSKWK